MKEADKDTRIPINEVYEWLPDNPFTIQQLGWMVSCCLIVGRKRKNYTEISLGSLQSLIDFRKKVLNEILK